MANPLFLAKRYVARVNIAGSCFNHSAPNRQTNARNIQSSQNRRVRFDFGDFQIVRIDNRFVCIVADCNIIRRLHRRFLRRWRQSVRHVRFFASIVGYAVLSLDIYLICLQIFKPCIFGLCRIRLQTVGLNVGAFRIVFDAHIFCRYVLQINVFGFTFWARIFGALTSVTPFLELILMII